MQVNSGVQDGEKAQRVSTTGAANFREIDGGDGEILRLTYGSASHRSTLITSTPEPFASATREYT